MNDIGIYIILNTINGKKYVGQSKRLARRHRRHFNELKNNNHVNSHLQRAWNKYGGENFEFKVILNCDVDDLTYYENFFINYFDSKNYGYNITDANQSFPDNSGENNGMYGKQSPIRRTDIDEHIYEIANQYKNGTLINELAEEWNTARKIIREKLRMVLTKEEMEKINRINQRSPKIERRNHLGTKHDLTSKMNMSKSNNTTGYFRVSIDEGYFYRYKEDNKRKRLYSKNLEVLKNKVITKGLIWKTDSESQFGYYNVKYSKTYIYKYYEGEKRRKISAKTIEELEEKVLKKGLVWYKFEEN